MFGIRSQKPMSQGLKLRITQTLLASWLRTFKEDSDPDEFLKVLRREPKQQTEAMLNGIRFENCVNGVLTGAVIGEEHEWYKPVRSMAYLLRGAQQQVTIFKEIEVDGIPFVLHGVLDYLRAGIIYDCKFSKTYKVGKYRSSPQHSMYLELVPEAREFSYLIADGSEWIYKETYTRETCEPIQGIIHDFIKSLELHGLEEDYINNWKIKE